MFSQNPCNFVQHLIIAWSEHLNMRFLGQIKWAFSSVPIVMCSRKSSNKFLLPTREHKSACFCKLLISFWVAVDKGTVFTVSRVHG